MSFGNQNLWASLKGAAASGILSGGLPYSGNFYYVGEGAPIFGQRVDTITNALARMIAKDVLILGPQAYEEGDLVIPATLSNITIIGTGARGSCYIEPSGAGENGLQVLADDVTLINVGIAKDSAGDYALKVGSQTVSPDRFRAYQCKIEGDGVAAYLQGAGDVLFDDCEFCWCAKALQLGSNDVGFCTQIRVRNSLFHNFTDFGLGQAAAAQVVNNLTFIGNQMDQQEDGTEPTDFILLADNGNTGLIADNMFAIATNDAAKLTIGTGIMWGPNGTEAGFSTARPA